MSHDYIKCFIYPKPGESHEPERLDMADQAGADYAAVDTFGSVHFTKAR
jgi:hypothetical protein